MSANYNEPIIHKRRTGRSDDPFIEINETLRLDGNAKAILTEIPNEYNRVRVTGDNREWYEITEGEIKENQYKVDYNNKIVTFHISNAGKQLTFKYLGEGMTLIPVSMIYTEHNGDIITTLSDYTNTLSKAVDTAKQMLNEEDERIANENERKSNENDRKSNESVRQTNENTRTSNENDRISNENTRQSNEKTRQTNENTRISNENTRQANEEVRQQQEQQRQDNTANAIANAQQATTNANNAATNANKAANNADEKANLAQEKAKLVQEKIDSLDTLKTQINQAITDSQTATTNANTSASNANDKANYAQQQGDYAKSQGDYAKQQGDAANLAVTNANEAITNANNAATNANKAANNANSAANNAQAIVDNTKFIEPYNPETTYQKNNIVSYNGSSFIAKQTTTGNTPIGDANDVYWGLLAQRGVDGQGAVNSVNNILPDVNGNITITATDVGSIPISQKGVPNGVASIDENGRVLDGNGNVVEGKVTSVNGHIGDVNLNANDVGAISISEKGVANGVALLNADGKVVDSNGNLVEGKVTSVNGQIGDVNITAADVGAETPEGAQAKANTAENNAKAYFDSQKGQPGGVATLGEDGKVPAEQLNIDTSDVATKDELTHLNLNVIDMAVELETLKGATLNGVTANIFIETFQNLNDINLMNGIYDSTNKRLVL
ncbi:hypothetical protein [Bacillus smithii]|uniref:hypothetical protein n=1 Tax=Bacillus smithii TaxID=1479 RepID=UPI003D211111